MMTFLALCYIKRSHVCVCDYCFNSFVDHTRADGAHQYKGDILHAHIFSLAYFNFTGLEKVEP